MLIKDRQVAEGAAATTTLAARTFDVVPYAGRYKALSARLELDFAPVITVLDRVPLCVERRRHASVRATVAPMVADARTRLQGELPRIVERRFAAFATPGAHDVMQEAVIPAVTDLLSGVIGIPLGLPHDTMLSRVFSQSIGIVHRRRLAAELTDLIARIAAAFPEEDAEMHATRAGLAIVGLDALTGTIGRSLHAHCVALDGRPFSALPLPTVPTHTGVPYIDRQVVVPHDDHNPGDLVRCLLQSLEGEAKAERMRFFGAGAHVCLGRALSLDLFQELSRYLSGLATRVEVTAYALRRDDVFALPQTFDARIFT